MPPEAAKFRGAFLRSLIGRGLSGAPGLRAAVDALPPDADFQLRRVAG